MRPVRAVGVYLVWVFLGGALLAPWVYHLVHSASAVLPGLESLASKPFPRYLNRCFLILGLLGLFPLLRVADLRSWRALGLTWRGDGGRQLGRGLVVGFVSIALIVVIVIGAGARELRHDRTLLALLNRIVQAVMTAGVVAILEEVFFRGVLFGALRKSFHWTVALGLSSVLYALLHFMERPKLASPIDWSSGFVVLLGTVKGFSDFSTAAPGFLNLLLAGIILGFAYQRCGSLHFSIGLHAGWIFWQKTYGFITAANTAGPSWFFGTGKLINGWLASAVLISLLLVITRTLAQDDPQTGWKERRLFQ